METQASNLAPSPIARIVLTGFMGAGKSTLGVIVAAELGWSFVDADEVMVEAEGLSIAALFEQAGESGFREMEERAIAGLLRLEYCVLALGGGALESEKTRNRLLHSPGTCVIFLQTPLEVAITRCRQQSGAAVRPILNDQAGLGERFTRRLDHYRKAHLTLDTVDRSPSELGRLLIESLEPRLRIAEEDS